MTGDPAAEPEPRVDYETSGEEYWAIEAWSALHADFSLAKHELPAWHDEFSAQGRAWEILRRLYRAAPLVGALDADDLRAWTRDEIAEKFSLSREIVDAEIAGAVKHWAQRKPRVAVAAEMALISPDELARLTRFSEGQGLDETVTDRLLVSLNFHQVTDKALRAEVAHRIISLKKYLAEPHTRVMAREVIRMEISMHGGEQRLLHYQGLLEEVMADKEELKFKRDVQQKKIEEYNGLIDNADAKLRKLSADHSKLLKELGADELDMTARKRIYVDTIAYLVEQCRIYETDPEHILADGVFTHGEIDWLLEPLGKRAPQYRPDISIRIQEALLPENLWNPDYIPTPIQRRVQRELLQMVKHLRAMPELPPEQEDAAANRLDEDDDADDEEEGGSIGDAVAALSAMGDVDPGSAAAPRYQGHHANANAAPAMGVF